MPPIRSRPRLTVLLWLVIAVALPLAAPTLNGVRLDGLPLGYWMSAQGAPLILFAILAWMGWSRGRA